MTQQLPQGFVPDLDIFFVFGNSKMGEKAAVCTICNALVRESKSGMQHAMRRHVGACHPQILEGEVLSIHKQLNQHEEAIAKLQHSTLQLQNDTQQLQNSTLLLQNSTQQLQRVRQQLRAGFEKMWSDMFPGKPFPTGEANSTSGN